MVERQNDAFSKVLLTTGSLSFLTTFLASRGRHSVLHERIAKLALVAEGLTILTGLGLKNQKADQGAVRPLKFMGLTELTTITACYGAVALTDEHLFRPLLRLPGSPNKKQALLNISKEILSDVRRNLGNGAKTVLKV